jgi:DNA helicase-2/ATP-dependent DNA helicase PcrA
MPQVINITDEDIVYAESVLLPAGKHFNDERKAYIRNFETADLLAVPGSGKTTSLLAKLLILERKLPFEDESGVLVLSHTNAAIDEIKNKLKGCSKIFAYPNFIGTIQSFVDEFLAIPYFVQEYKRKPVRIDSEIYDEIASKRFANMQNVGARNWLNQKFEPEQYFKNLRFDTDWNLTEGLHGTICLRSANNSATYQYLRSIKESILQTGFLNYDDAYFLSELYLIKYPQIKQILQHRFSLVFVDEMQDMDTHQYELLEKVFYDNGQSISKIQRIGDKNQAIYNSVKAVDVWQERQPVLRLNDSMRLSGPIANAVSKFALYSGNGFVLNGLNECTLKPHVLVYENSTLSQVIPYFSTLVKDYKDGGHLIDFDRHPIKVVAWNTDWKEDADRNNIDRTRLIHYYSPYSKEKAKSKNDYPNLKHYLLYYDKNKSTLDSIRKNILNAVLKILRIENILYNNERVFTKRLLLDFMKATNPTQYEEFKLNLYNWSIAIVRGQLEPTIASIRAYLPTLSLFNGNPLNASQAFIDDEVIIAHEENQVNVLDNTYQGDGFSMEVTSVHAVKGQTHCATLYLESFFDRGYGNFESQRLRNQFNGRQTVEETIASIANSRDKVRQSAKMAFVGLSRPTNFLCVAVHKSRFDAVLNTIDRDIWEVLYVPSNDIEN